MTTQKLMDFIAIEEKKYDFNNNMKNYIDEAELTEAIKNNTVADYLNSLNDEYQITDTEVIGYYNATKYILENDPSMRQCFEIASDYGYDIKDINSELLASLLQSKDNQDTYIKFIDTVIEYIN